MVCTKCGCEQGLPARFCRQCGAAIEAPAAPPPQQQAAWAPDPATYYAQAKTAEQRLRVRQNLQPLGILWCVFGAYRIFAMVIGMAFLHGIAAGGMFGNLPEPALRMMHAAIPVIGFMVIVMGALDILTGYALLTQQKWARILAIIMAILALIKIPFGTALGIYTLWVLAPQASGAEWDAMTRLRA